jgi:Reverse transcriptase (RNA-dependent DNA polymerase)
MIVVFYLKKLDGGDYIYLLLYVDDMLIAATNMGEIKKLKEQLGMAFSMKDLGVVKKILGMEIIRNRSNRKLLSLTKGVCWIGYSLVWHGESKYCFNSLAAHFKLSRFDSNIRW